MHHWNFFLVTFGCKVNQYETQALREAWTAQGGVECSMPSLADVLCINSCAITAKGERDARNAVYRLRREAPKARLILTGCSTRLFASYTPCRGAASVEPDLLVPQEEKYRLLAGPWPDMHVTFSSTVPFNTAYPPFCISSFQRTRPVLKVQDGCNHRCTYCIVPLTRGRSHSRPIGDILNEAHRLLMAGYTELIISGINLGQYGRDTDGNDFWSLLKTLDVSLAPQFYGKARLRLSSLEPGLLNQRGIDTLLSCRMLCPHLHISLQHGSQRVLKRMGRGHYAAAMLETALDNIAQHWPVMGLGADFITGFPGETEEDMDILLALVQRLPLSYAHVFPYSRRPGTAAAHFDDQIPHTLALTRSARLREVIAQKKVLFFQSQCTLPQMYMTVDRPDNGERLDNLKGINEYYVPCFLSPALDVAAFENIAHHRGLLAVRPISWTMKGLLVQPMEKQKTPAGSTAV
ncbi:MAG: MiaB/RimO family radical SAM methylthiotransferase [Desulfovibrio sp.]|nr:MiaB/RimO family radical SAM methylthiotransferase [Desulfovibrio sp.]